MKKNLIILFLVVLLSACTNTGPSSEPTGSQPAEGADTAALEQLQQENAKLQEQLEQGEEADKAVAGALRETLNMTFRLITAMDDKDYDYITSVSSTNVEVSQEKNMLIVRNEQAPTDAPTEVALLNGLELAELEFRGFEQTDESHAVLFMARVSTTEGAEGNAALNFQFIRSGDGAWQFDGLLTN